MEKLFRYFAERNLVAYLISLLIILVGVSSLLTIKRDSFPKVKFGTVLVTTIFPGASPEDVELKVTNKLEKEIKQVTGIKRYISWSMENLSVIYIMIDPGIKDASKVSQDISEAVTRVTDLPSEVKESPLVKELGTSIFPMMEIALSGDVPYTKLRETARLFEKKLENIPGVSSVKRFGYRKREIRVEVNPKALSKNIISLGRVISAIRNQNIRGTGGTFESYISEKNIVTLAQFRNPLDVAKVIVQAGFSGPVIRVSDLAKVKDTFEDEKIISRVNGHRAVSFIAFKSESADIIRTVDKIKKLIKQEQDNLPVGIKLFGVDDRSKYVRNRFNIVLSNGLIGLSMVFIVLTLFLNFRVAFWVALGIPITVLGVISLLPLFDSFLDSITLTALVLVLGIIVDDAIIISENIYRMRERGLAPVDAAVVGVSRVFKPVITTILTTFLAFSTLFFMPGMMGKFVYVIPLVITLALVVSLIESTLALPAHLVGGLSKLPIVKNGDGVSGKSAGLFRTLQAWLTKILPSLLRFRYLVTLVFIGILASVIFYALNFMNFVMFPSSSADRFHIRIETPLGTPLTVTAQRAQEVEKIVKQLPETELDTYLTRIGTFGTLRNSERENNAAVSVALTPFANRKRTADQIVATIKPLLDKIEGLKKLTVVVESGGPPVGRPIKISIVGSDDKLRTQLTDNVVSFLKSIDGTKDIDRDDKAGKDQVEIKPKHLMLARAGITVSDIAQNVRSAFDGEIVTSVRYGDEDVDFRVIYPKYLRQNLSELYNLPLPNSNNRLTPLSAVASFENSKGPANIAHYKGERSVTVTGDIDKTSTTSLLVANAVKERFKINKNFPGIRIIIRGEAKESQNTLKQTVLIVSLVCIGIYFLLVLLFNSLWQPLIVMTAIPFGIIGVIVGFALHNEALGFLAITGVIGLTGVVVNDSLVLVNHVNDLRKKNLEISLLSTVVMGASNRLRAILLTTISTVAGLLPLAYGIGGSDPFMSPMAMAITWGLLFSTPLTLILIPCLYLIIDDLHCGMKKLFRQDG